MSTPCSLPQDTKVLQQDFRADEDEHAAAEELRAGAVLGAEHAADLDARRREQEGDHADKGHGGADVHPQKGEGDTHGHKRRQSC